MRVLFATYPAKTHFHAMVPLAWALRGAGHEVTVAAQPGFAAEINQAGLTAVPVGADRSLGRMLEANPALLEELRAEGDARAGDLTWEDVKDEYSESVTWWYKMENVPMIHSLVTFARRWRPDLVVWEPTTSAGAIAAKACGAAHARLMYTPDSFGLTRANYLRLRPPTPAPDESDTLAEWLASYADKYGARFSEDMVTGQFTIDHFPDSLRLDAGLAYVRTRYVPYGGAAVVPDWLTTPPRRPRIAITLGMDAFADELREILGSLAELDVEVVATVPDDRRAALGPVPGNVRLVSYVPLLALVPTCSVVIHHAGAGTLATTSLYGVPQLVLRLSLEGDFDEPELVDGLTGQGAGVAVRPGAGIGTAVRNNVVRLLEDPRFRERAAALRAEMLSLPSPAETVGELERLAAEHRGR
ncbi:activator-dependent family glycosyltransferase [Nonomuraea jabiensis]|uniref:activator-dependent family glycosyltransferase n=1 Tax=Nonomuraea jabiensis TaxID=882448 RepID=UPI0036B2FDE2